MAKSGNANRHVVQNPRGGWDVRKPGSSRASAHAGTQSDAVDAARKIVRNGGGGEVRIHGLNGRISDSNTIAAAKAPLPPRDQR